MLIKQILLWEVLDDFYNSLACIFVVFIDANIADHACAELRVPLWSIGNALTEMWNSHWLISTTLPADQRKHSIANARGDLNWTNIVLVTWRIR